MIHVKDKALAHHSYYVDECYVLNIKVSCGHNCAGWTLQSASHFYEGSDINSLVNTLHNLIDDYNLEKHNSHSCDYLMIYVDDLTKIRGFLYNYISKSDDHVMYIDVFDCIEFRSYRHWTKDKDMTIVLNTMISWFNLFIKDGYVYFTPNQLNRKRIRQLMPDCCVDVYPDRVQYNQVMKAIHGGVLYYNNIPAKGNMLGLDIVSAYIYGLVFCKHPVSKPENADTADWDSYLGKADVGSIGIYEIDYDYPINNISCYKDLNDEPLKAGHHIVRVALTNVDLKLMFDLKYMHIHNCKCLYLLDYKLDYLPKTFRDYCVSSYIHKCSLTKHTIEYDNSKVQLNGIFGNLILGYVKDAYDKEYKKSHDVVKATKAADKAYDDLDKSTRPEWGVFTMAYCKQLIYALGTQIAGWRYSDTDSIYCDKDSANIEIINAFNTQVMNNNFKLCEQLGYVDHIDDICKLGTFDFESDIERFRVWGNKTYAYKTVDGDYIVKAAGCNKEELPADDSIFDDPEYKPKVGTRTYSEYDETGYYESTSRNKLALLRGLART